MTPRFKFDGLDYEISRISKEGREFLNMINFIDMKLKELKNGLALLSKAKNAYIEDMKLEIVQGRTGVDFSDLLSDE